jgi:RND family efflux transporter MFP subunit
MIQGEVSYEHSSIVNRQFFMTRSRTWFFLIVLLLAGGLAWAVWSRLQEPARPPGLGAGVRPVPVEAAPVEHGPMALRRTFSGTLESPAEFLVAPKVSGRVEAIPVDLGDAVQRGQIVARLDNDEYVQAVAQAEAELAVARAHLSEAGSALHIAERELKRIETLKKRGVASASQLDAARAEQLAARSGLEVTKAQAAKAEASLETARIRLGYTTVAVDWTGGDAQRHVSERLVDPGDTVAANTPLLGIVELHPLTGVVFVPEKDYARLAVGQSAGLLTDAFPGETFKARISRIAPVFEEATRQARVELRVDNPEQRLKPGMFIRATVVLDRVAEAVIIPEAALTERSDQTGVFLLQESGRSVTWQPVRTGIHEDGKIQVLEPELAGRVVTLGQHLLEHGSAVSIPESPGTPSSQAP